MSLSMLPVPPSDSPMNEDVWTVIAQCCDPRDLMSLASTSRYLYDALDTRSTWNDLLHRVCERYGIMNGTYATGNMTLQQVKQASCRPQAWMKPALRPGVHFHHAIRKPLPRLSAPVRLPLASFEQMTPGGRFLIRVQEWGPKCTLEISQLPPPTEAHTIRLPIPIAQHVIPGTSTFPLKVRSCTTLDDVFVSVTWHDTDHDTNHSYVYSIKPSTQTTWTTYAHLTFPHIYYGTDTAMTLDYVHFNLGGDYVFSWQFHENKVLKWRTPGQGFAHRLIAHPQNVLLCLENCISVFPHASLAPLLNPYDGSSLSNEVTLPAIHTISYPSSPPLQCTVPYPPRLNPTRQNPIVLEYQGSPYGVVDAGDMLALAPVSFSSRIDIPLSIIRCDSGPNRVLLRQRWYHTYPTTNVSFSPAYPTRSNHMKVVDFCHLSGRAHFKHTENDSLFEHHVWVDI